MRDYLQRLIPTHAGKTLAGRRSHDRGPAHPRSRGENGQKIHGPIGEGGSSPLTRGKPVAVFVDAVPRGLIPAHAGKTKTSPPLEPVGTAHPRSRGENEIARAEDVNQNGSSPLTRGKLARGLTGGRGRRLIPAHAGKTGPAASEAPRPRADPRSYGENCRARTRPKSRYGSSPLTRGKPRGEGAPCVPEGLIPAHAGKTPHIRGLRPLRSAHPRSRGENSQAEETLRPHTGSSPLTRGKLCWASGEVNSPVAHPRSRGENYNDARHALAVEGSSPLTRGKRGPREPFRDGRGLIPAHAGKTSSRRCRPWRTSAHPRSRGENLNAVAGGNADTGSSPLTRGKRRRRHRGARRNRLIPAHAGKTTDERSPALRSPAHPRSRGENTWRRSSSRT